MANEALERAGMYFDDLNRIRVLDEETSSQVSYSSFKIKIHEIISKYAF